MVCTRVIICFAVMTTVLMLNLRPHMSKRSSSEGPRRSMTRMLWSPPGQSSRPGGCRGILRGSCRCGTRRGAGGVRLSGLELDGDGLGVEQVGAFKDDAEGALSDLFADAVVYADDVGAGASVGCVRSHWSEGMVVGLGCGGVCHGRATSWLSVESECECGYGVDAFLRG